MPKTLLRIGQSLLIAAMFLAVGGHWLVLQTVAWSTMLAEYSRETTLTQAVAKTFDGEHPCQMCRSIQKTQETQQKPEGIVLLKKIDVFLQSVTGFLPPPPEFCPLVSFVFAAEMRTAQPPVPPPRVA